MVGSTGTERRKEAFRRPATRALAVVFLLLLTAGLFELAPRYEITGPELLRNGGFEDGLEEWTVHGAKGAATAASGVVVLESDDPSRSVGIRQILPAVPGQEILLLAAEVSTQNVRQGTKSWYAARVYLVGRTAEGKSLVSIPHVLVTQIGDNSWRRYSAAFPVAGNVKEVVVGAQLIRTTGVMRLRDLRLVPVRERAAFRGAGYALLAAWAVALAWIGGSLLHDIGSALFRGLVAVVTLAITAGVLMPGPVKQELLTSAWSAYERLGPALAERLSEIAGLEWGGAEYLGFNISQITHFALFFVLAALARFAWPADRRAFQFLCLLLFAAVTEALQYFVAGRQPTVQDWSFDAGGIFLAFALSSVLGALRNDPAAEAIAHRDGAEGPPAQ